MTFDIDDYDPKLCPFCGSGDVGTLGRTADTVKRRCRDCGEGFLLVYDEPHDRVPIEVLDGHGRAL